MLKSEHFVRRARCATVFEHHWYNNIMEICGSVSRRCTAQVFANTKRLGSR